MPLHAAAIRLAVIFLWLLLTSLAHAARGIAAHNDLQRQTLLTPRAPLLTERGQDALARREPNHARVPSAVSHTSAHLRPRSLRLRRALARRSAGQRLLALAGLSFELSRASAVARCRGVCVRGRGDGS